MEAQRLVQDELDFEESVQWIGKPSPTLFNKKSIPLVLFGLVATSFAIFWTVTAWSMGNDKADDSSLFPFFGLPFILVGLGMLCSPLWFRWKASKTVYVLTDRRAITFDGGLSTTIRSYPPAKLQDIYRNEHSNGLGDVVFATRDRTNSNGHPQTEELGFLDIPAPKEVELKLQELAKSAQHVP